MDQTLPPISIRRIPERQVLEVAWPDGLARELALVPLRAQCMCARCVDEITGERIIEVEGIDPKIAVSELQLVGNYALRIHWSDGHHQGLYTWPHLRRLCEAD
jgi:DUF971 family protein